VLNTDNTIEARKIHQDDHIKTNNLNGTVLRDKHMTINLYSYAEITYACTALTHALQKDSRSFCCWAMHSPSPMRFLISLLGSTTALLPRHHWYAQAIASPSMPDTRTKFGWRPTFGAHAFDTPVLRLTSSVSMPEVRFRFSSVPWAYPTLLTLLVRFLLRVGRLYFLLHLGTAPLC